MKHLNPINEYAKIISGRSNGASDEKIISDNIFYFDNLNIKDIIDYATASIGDKTENFTINHGWISVNDYENPGFEYSQHTNLKGKARTANVKVYECYKLVFYNSDYGQQIEHDGTFYSDNISFIVDILPDVKNAVDKLKKIDNCSVSFNMDGNSIDLLIHVSL